MTGNSDRREMGRNQGRIIEAAEAEFDKPSNGKREEGRYVPVSESGLDDAPPESIPGNDTEVGPDGTSDFELKPLPIKGLRSFLYAAVLLVTIYVVIELYQTTAELWSAHWLLGTFFLLLVGTVLILGLRAVFSYFSAGDALNALEDIRDISGRMRYSRDKGVATQLTERMTEFYSGKPQSKILDDCLANVADYYDDSEVLACMEKSFLEILDAQAIEKISQNCLYTGTAIAISPWAVMDIGLALWRNVKLLEDVASIYGFRPSLRNRVHLFKMVTAKMAFVGGSQALMNSAVEGVSSLGVGVPLVASFAQGVGAGVYTGKIGIAAMEASRPVAFDESCAPSLSAIVSPTIEELKSNLLKLAVSNKG